MSAERCLICGVSGTSTKRCCGNNSDFRLEQIKKQLDDNNRKILLLKKENIDLIIERIDLKNEKKR